MYNIQALYGPSTTNYGPSDAQVYGLSPNGKVAGIGFPQVFDPSLGMPVMYEVGAVWMGASLNFSLPLQSESLLYSINSAGDAVGARATGNSPTQIAILVRGSSVVDLAPVVGNGSMATHINDGGLVCGWGWNNPRAFVYDANTNTVVSWIDPLPGKKTSGASAINAVGQVVGMSDDHGFLFTSGVKKDLGLSAFVTKVNNAGIVCGSVVKPYPENFHAAICDTSQPSPSFVEIPTPPGFLGSHGEGINSAGDVVGTCWTAESFNGAQSAYVFHQGASTDLNTLISDPGWHLEFAEDINDAGQITGFGTRNGEQTAFLLTPPSIFGGRGKIISLPELIATLLGGVDRDGGGWAIIGGYRIPIGPWGPWMEIQAAKRDALVVLGMDEIATYLIDRGARQEVRGILIEVARQRLDNLKQNLGEGRFGPTGRAQIGTRRRALQDGRPAEALKRFRPSGE